ncbi:MAG: nucleotidyltransferase domain-containing protein [Cellulosilyticaceae bacterium]
MIKRLNIDKTIVADIRGIASTMQEITCIKLFGSRVRGDHRETSDIDLAVFGENIDKMNFIYEIETKVQTLLEFDVSYMNEIQDEAFIQQVEKEGVTLYEKS